MTDPKTTEPTEEIASMFGEIPNTTHSKETDATLSKSNPKVTQTTKGIKAGLIKAADFMESHRILYKDGIWQIAPRGNEKIPEDQMKWAEFFRKKAS